MAVKANPFRPQWGEGGRPECWAFLRCRWALKALETHSGGWAEKGCGRVELPIPHTVPPLLAEEAKSRGVDGQAGKPPGSLVCPKLESPAMQSLCLSLGAAGKESEAQGPAGPQRALNWSYPAVAGQLLPNRAGEPQCPPFRLTSRLSSPPWSSWPDWCFLLRLLAAKFHRWPRCAGEVIPPFGYWMIPFKWARRLNCPH